MTQPPHWLTLVLVSKQPMREPPSDDVGIWQNENPAGHMDFSAAREFDAFCGAVSRAGAA